ncbi:hypothetical protein TorRG33x02_073820 [Trema orientale]|uniref:Protein PATRONUS 2 n=1 Tax=Trema orientale TaxID=63057 RepID=A0A2P5FGU4_TREOI|nr:hypothetical protein TorRG33x02_073820 [Trema orientale]
MASQLGLLFQDQNFNVQYSGASAGGKTNAIKAQKKGGGGGGLGGRKPLGEISNSVNIAPQTAQASKKQNSKNFASSKEVAHEEKSRKRITNTSDKVQTRSRKALADISNSGKPHLHLEAPKNKQNMKLTIVEDHSFPNSIAEEQFLHDHRKCIKAQSKPMDMDQFLVTVGLDNVSSKQFESPWAFSKSSKMKPENPLHQLELEEMSEHLIEDENLWKQKLKSPPCKTPKSPNYNTLWKDLGKDYEHINFKLMETPDLSKHCFPPN